MRTFHSVFLAFLALAFLALGGAASAQTQITTAVIEGVVTDRSGAALPGVDIEIRNPATNLTRNVLTDREGRFAAPQLPSGRYTVTFKLAGFATVVQENVIATIGEAVQLNTPMRISGVAETVTVSAQTPT